MNIAAVALALALLVAFGLFGRQAWRLYRTVRAGKPTSRFDDIPSRARAEAVVVRGRDPTAVVMVCPFSESWYPVGSSWGFVEGATSPKQGETSGEKVMCS